MRKIFLAGVIGLSLGVLPLQARATDIWLTGDPIAQAAAWPGQTYDYMQMFQPNAPWSGAAATVRVFKVSTQWILTSSDATLQQMFSDLQRRGIALAVEALMIPQTSSCGTGIEGYSSPGTMLQVANRVKALGSSLQYVAMDEPLTFGHLATGANTCQTPITTLAQTIASNVTAIRSVFPSVKIGDIELLSDTTPLAQIMQFATAYQTATGTPLDFIHIDVDWTKSSWWANLQQLVTLIQAASIKVGIIYNTNTAVSNVDFTQQAEQHFSTIEATITPDHAILQTWSAYPTQMLPETQPGTMTYLVSRYVAAQTMISVQIAGNQITGTLTTEGSIPVQAANVALSATDLSTNGVLATQTMTGTVPAGAVTGMWAMRINTECGGCSGPANITVGTMSYKDTAQTATRHFNYSNYVAQPGQTWTPNATPFTVTAGAAYTLSVPMQIPYASRNSGYVAMIWLNQAGVEVLPRQELPFTPLTMSLGVATTAANGTFSATSALTPAMITAQYTGSSEWVRETSAVAQ